MYPHNLNFVISKITLRKFLCNKFFRYSKWLSLITLCERAKTTEHEARTKVTTTGLKATGSQSITSRIPGNDLPKFNQMRCKGHFVDAILHRRNVDEMTFFLQ